MVSIKAGMAVAVVLTSLIGGTRAEATGSDTRIVVHVQDAAHVGGKALREAQRAADQAFEHMGVRVVWTDGSYLTRAPDGLLHLDVLILDQAMTVTKNPPPRALGQASYAGRRAYVFHPRVLSHAQQTTSDPTRVLAYALTHEIGHLLLTIPGHVGAGIMQADCGWRRIVKIPSFMPQQEQAILTRLLNGEAVSTEAPQVGGVQR